LFVTGEASWGDVIAAENCAAAMVCLGHYETEVFGVRGLAKAMKRALGINTVDLTEELR
jgi:putative NIF3 family GTP cyclohydrolase 1 type 2